MSNHDTQQVRRMGQKDRKHALPRTQLVLSDEAVKPSPLKADDRFPPIPTVDPEPSPAVKTKSVNAKRRSFKTQNLVTLLFLLATVGLIVYFAFIWQNPWSPANFLAPPTPLPIYVTATPGAS